MTKKDFQNKILKFLGVLVIVPREKKKQIQEALPNFTLEQLERMTEVLSRAFQAQVDLLKKGFEKNPGFAQEFEIYQGVQIEKATEEAMNKKDLGLMKNYLNFKAEWQKNH